MAGYLISTAVLLLGLVMPCAHAEMNESSAADSPKKVNRQSIICQQVFFSDHQSQSLAQDKPLRDLVLSNEHLYVLGQQHVWRFDLGKSALRKFSFAPASSLYNAYLARDNANGATYLATPQMLFEMRSDEPKVVKYFPNQLSEVFGFMVAPENYIWLTAKGIYLLERQSLQLRYIRYMFKPSDRVIVSPSLRSFYLLRGDRLLLVDQNLQDKEILRADDLWIGTDNQALYVQRDAAILRYTFAGELLQTIPVMNSRTLVGMHFAPNWHSYMFSDGLFEHYQLSNKKVVVGRCAGSKASAGSAGKMGGTSDLDVFAGRLAFIDGSNPHMYELRQ